MQKRGISQEMLKMIACVAMLLDHIGVTILLACFYRADGITRDLLLELYQLFRAVGRLAFPIYCFLLAEGVHHTRDAKRYGLRLLIAAVLSEIPYDLAVYGGINWQHQNVMVTLLLGFSVLEVMKKCPALLWKALAVIPFALAAQWLHTDYGARGVLTVVLFGLTRQMNRREILQFLGLWFIFSPNHLMMLNWLDGLSVTLQELAVLAVVPISLYDGRKTTNSKAVRWGFYLFYPAHLLALYFIGRL